MNALKSGNLFEFSETIEVIDVINVVMWSCHVVGGIGYVTRVEFIKLTFWPKTQSFFGASTTGIFLQNERLQQPGAYGMILF